MARSLAFAALVALAGCPCGAAVTPPSGPAPLPALPQASVRLVQDTLGITHVYGESDLDAFYGDGYAQARDRLWQMEMNRRRALGTQSEILGAAALPDDKKSRTLGFGRLGEADAALLAATRPDDYRLAEAWAAGVNARIADVASGAAPRPWGFRASENDFVPAPWTVAHAFAVGKSFAFGLSNTLDQDILATAAAVLAPRASDLPLSLPSYDRFIVPTTPTSVGPLPAPRAPKWTPLRPRAARTDATLRASFGSFMPDLVSNNWAVDGAHTDSGRPYLCNDPHLGLTSPTTMWPVHISGGAFDVVGFAFVGTPGVSLGHNARIGWAATTNFADVMDLLDVPADANVTFVEVGGVRARVATRDEVIRVRGEGMPLATGDDVHLTVRAVPGYGVLLDESVLPLPKALLARGEVLFLWTGFSATHEAAAYLALDRAQSLDAFEAAVDLLQVGAVNFLGADATGIDYRVHADVPDRGDPRSRPMPWHVVDGTDPRNAWTHGYLPNDKLPHARGSPKGYLHSENNDPFGFTADGDVENDPYYYGAFFANGQRSERVESELARMVAAGKVTRAQLEALQGDVHSVTADQIVPLVVEAVAAIGTDPALDAWKGRQDLKDLAASLSAWDRRMARPSDAALAFLGVTWFAVKRTFQERLTPAFFFASSSKSPAFLLGQLQNVLGGRFATAKSWLPVGARALLVASLDDTAKWLAQLGEGATPRYEELWSARFASPFPALDARHVPVDGSNDTVNVAYAAFFDAGGAPLPGFAAHEMANFRVVTGFAEDGTPETTLDFARGASGDPGDPHYADAEPLWTDAGHVPLPFRKADVDAAAIGTVTLAPAK